MMAAVQGATGDVDAIATTTSASARGFVSAAKAFRRRRDHRQGPGWARRGG